MAAALSPVANKNCLQNENSRDGGRFTFWACFGKNSNKRPRLAQKNQVLSVVIDGKQCDIDIDDRTTAKQAIESAMRILSSKPQTV